VKTKVRCNTKMVFEIDPITLEAKTCSSYDPWCYSNLDPDVTYLELHEWLNKNPKLKELNKHVKR
jgi:hypothetical protein